MSDYLAVKIVTPSKVIFDGQAGCVSSKNSKGGFDVLPDHTNFITVIKEDITLISANGREQKIDANLGIMRCLDGRVEVYLGICAPPPKTQ